MLGASQLDRDALTAAILRELTTRIQTWRAATRPDPALVEDYRRRSATLGSRVRALMPGEHEITGTAIDIDELGRLRIDTGAKVTAVSAGDITHLRPAD
jgi:BirA family biotin operon repressor/biotin-[acetyl-CoA-carboxylase] ligase